MLCYCFRNFQTGLLLMSKFDIDSVGAILNTAATLGTYWITYIL